MSTLREYEEAAERLDGLLDITDCTERDSIAARRSALLEVQEDIMVVKAMATEEMGRSLDQFKSGRGGTSYKTRQAWFETVNRCKADLFAINKAMHDLRARGKAVATFESNSAIARPQSRDLYRICMHFVALSEAAMDADAFKALLDRSRALTATKARVSGPSIERLAAQLKVEINGAPA